MESNSRPYVYQLDPSRSGHPSGLPPQRVPLSQSMLYAYAAMRGNSDKGHPYGTDPVHANLYLQPTSFIHPGFELPCDLINWQLTNDPHMAQEAPGGAIWFADVSNPAYFDPAPPQKAAQEGDTGLSYEQHMRKYFPRYMANHYTGSEGYGNHGFVKVNGHWIDPDSKKEIDDAENDVFGIGRVPKLPIGTGSFLQMAQDQFYAEYVQDVAKGLDGDGEGDPRSSYITPGVFATWVAGAAVGDRYVPLEIEPSEVAASQLRPCKRLPNPNKAPKTPAVKAQPQFDEDNGSIYSGEYSLDSSPSLCRSSRGVNMLAQPSNYGYMLPEMRILLDREVYGDPNAGVAPRVESWLSSSTATSAMIMFEEEAIVNALAGSEPPEIGIQKWHSYLDRVDGLEAEHRKLLERLAPDLAREAALTNEQAQLYHEAYFMENRLQKREIETGSAPTTPRIPLARIVNRPAPSKVPFHPTPRNDLLQTASYTREMANSNVSSSAQRSGAAVSSSLNQTLDQDIPNLSPSAERSGSNANPREHRKLLRQVRRIDDFFKDQEERRIININKTHAMNQNLEVELTSLTEAMGDLRVAHKGMLVDLGVNEVSDIPNLIPVRKKRPRPFDPPTEAEESEETVRGEKGKEVEKGEGEENEERAAPEHGKVAKD